MATGGIFTLVTNDGRQDRMLMATDYLNKRLASIAATRTDRTATLTDVERTHILFMNAHFKPFAAIGFEYNKVKSSAGSPQLGSQIQFSIPQFGDFFHDMVLHVILKQPSLVVTATAQSDQPAMRWCNYPGERLCRKVQFEVNGNPLDEYYSVVYNFFRNFQVQPNKQLGYDRCMGQEIPLSGYVDTPDWPGSGRTAVYEVDGRSVSTIVSGPQTPSVQKVAPLELFVPLLFWCNKDPRLAVPSVAIPYGQRFINIDLATQQELVNVYPRGLGTWTAPGGYVDTSANIIQTVELYINNIFVNPEIHDIFIKRVGFNLIRVHRVQTNACSNPTDEILLQQLKWPIETLFVGMKPAIADAVGSSTAQYLSVWDQFNYQVPTSRSQIGWFQYKALQPVNQPVGTTFTVAAGGILTWIGAGVNIAADLQPGDVFTYNSGGPIATRTTVSYNVAALTSATTAQLNDTAPFAIGPLPLSSTSIYRLSNQTSSIPTILPTLDSVTIVAHGIPIYKDFPSAFYNAYIPYQYGGFNIKTPSDIGALMIPFNLYPGTYQPSGHINVSRAREFYLNYASSYVTSSTPGRLYVVASAINFLLISDGSAVLRYST